MGYIYKITNLVNGKIYVGKTCFSIYQRLKDHFYEAGNNMKGCSYLNNAIRQYGEENFIVEPLEECEEDSLNEREIFWIKELNSHVSCGNGYNISWGGEGTLKISDEQILDLWNKGYLSHQIAKELNVTENTISSRLKILKPGQARKRYVASRKIPVNQYDLDGILIKEWDSAIDAARFYGSNDSGSIVRCCKKQMVSAFNSLWKYKDDKTSVENLMIAYAKSMSCREVLQIDPNTKQVIKKYKSGADAERQLGLPRGKVSEVCNHKRKTCGNYYWEWAYKIKREIANGTYRITEENN